MKDIVKNFDTDGWLFWMEDVLNGNTLAYPITRWSSDEEPGETLTKMARYLHDNETDRHFFNLAVENLMVKYLENPQFNVAKIDAMLGVILYTKSPQFKVQLIDSLSHNRLQGLHYRNYTLQAILLQALTAIGVDTLEYDAIDKKIRQSLEKGPYDPAFYGKALEFSYRSSENRDNGINIFFNYLTIICRKAKGRWKEEKHLLLQSIFKELLLAIHNRGDLFYEKLYIWLCEAYQIRNTKSVIRPIVHMLRKHFSKIKFQIGSGETGLYAKVLYLNLICKFQPHKDWIVFFMELSEDKAPEFLLKKYLAMEDYMDRFIRIYATTSLTTRPTFVWKDKDRKSEKCIYCYHKDIIAFIIEASENQYNEIAQIAATNPAPTLSGQDADIYANSKADILMSEFENDV